jgi:membrane-associated phospholipid phosphatase
MANPYLEPMYIITLLGEPLFWALLCPALIAYYFFIRNRNHGQRHFLKNFLPQLALGLAVSLLVVFFLKMVFPMARPCTPCTVIQMTCNPYCPLNDTSFPSAHAASAFAAYTSLWLVQRKGWQLPIFVLPLAVAYSRVALGVHVWIDIIIGSAIGFFATILTWRELRKTRLFGEKRHAAHHR